MPSSPLQNWNDDMTGRGIPLLVVSETLPRPQIVPSFGALLLVLVVMWQCGSLPTGVGCTCGWCWPWRTSGVRRHNVGQVGMSDTGRHHDDVAGNDLKEIQKVC